MPKRTLPEDWNDWASEDYENYIGEFQDMVDGSDDPSEMSYDEDFEDEDLYGFHEVPVDELFGAVDPVHAPPKPPAKRSLTWHYDDSGYYAYVLLSGDETQRKETVRLLTSKGIVCSMSGRSYRPANDQNQYDWYVRVYKRRSDGSLGKPTNEDILEAMPSQAQGISLSPAQKDYVRIIGQHAKRLEEDVKQARKELQDANHSLYAATAELLRKERDYQQVFSKLHELEVRSGLERIRLQEIQTELETRLLEHAKEIDKYRSSTEEVEERELEGSIELEELRNAIARSKAEYYNVEHEWLQAEARLQEQGSQLIQLTNERDIALAELEEARQQLDAVEKGLGSQPNLLSQPEIDIEPLLAVLLPNVRFLRGSLTFLFRETKDPLLALKELRRLSISPESVKGTRVESAKDWLEIHFSTGDSPKGRMYFTKPNDAQFYYVLVSHKDVQKRDFRRLAQTKSIQ